MRDIIFKGKRKDNGEWIIGLFIKDCEIYGYKDEHTYVVTHEHPSSCFGSDIYFEVLPETVGQYTGLTDKNGKKIFEGDIVVFLDSTYQVVFECGSFGLAGVNDWEAIEKQIPIRTGCDNDLSACLNDNYISLWEIYWNLENNHEVLDTVKIIGNIHDNPELLEVK